ncbi:MAG: DNA repair exonuclease, partial [Methanobrevibacter sp.]|nr:DNA repair exonuclease [Methanobrevibacter sp.]
GYRQYGLYEREKDFYEVFEKIIDRIIEEKVDFVIHSGDLFETSRPSPMALLTFQKGLLKLKGAGIPMYAIAGNHDLIMRKGSIPPQVIFKKLGLKVISKINPTYMHGDVLIAGLQYYPASNDKVLKNKLSDLSKKAADHDKSILVLHQGIGKYFGYQYELEISDIPDNFNYYALGHIHKYVNDDFGNGKLVYPGSTEIWKTKELDDYKKNGKGFVVVDLEGQKPHVKRIKVDISREFIKKSIDYNKLNDEISKIHDLIKDYDKKPIIDLEIRNVDGDTSTIYDAISSEIGDLALMIRPTFKAKADESIDDIIGQNDSLGPKELILENLKDYDNEDVNKLAIDLYDLLSKDNIEDSEELITQFYEQHYKTKDSEDAEDEESSDDVQVTLNEGLK